MAVSRFSNDAIIYIVSNCRLCMIQVRFESSLVIVRELPFFLLF